MQRLFPLYFELRELGHSDGKWSSLKEEIASLREKETFLVEDIETAKNGMDTHQNPHHPPRSNQVGMVYIKQCKF
jgi:hypothetical protein